jgi:hypothetical protein
MGSSQAPVPAAVSDFMRREVSSMRSKVMLFIALALVLGCTAATATPLTYVISNFDNDGTHHFGTVDLATGTFTQIGPNPDVGSEGLAAGPNGLLFTIAYNSDLFSINPGTGEYTLVGPTGLGDCSTPDSLCGPTSSLTLGGANGNIYAMDFQNRIYNVNPLTGAATLIGATGIPPIPFVPAAINSDGTIDFYEEAVFGTGGKLYATFDALYFDLATSSVASVAVPPALYQIDPSTGLATVLGPTDLSIGAVVSLNGTPFAFNLLQGEIFDLNVANGSTSFVVATDPNAGTVRGAAVPTPEPASMGLVIGGIAALAVCRHLRRCLGA